MSTILLADEKAENYSRPGYSHPTRLIPSFSLSLLVSLSLYSYSPFSPRGRGGCVMCDGCCVLCAVCCVSATRAGIRTWGKGGVPFWPAGSPMHRHICNDTNTIISCILQANYSLPDPDNRTALCLSHASVRPPCAASPSAPTFWPHRPISTARHRALMASGALGREYWSGTNGEKGER